MRNSNSTPAVVVGIDGSRAATAAAVWAIDEAVSRDVPLRLIYVIDPADLPADAGHAPDDFAFARAALRDGKRAVEASRTPVKVETQIQLGLPLAALVEASRSAVALCVGSIGIKHSRYRVGSVAAAVASAAHCPVAVVRPRAGQSTDAGYIVVEVDGSPDSGVVLEHAVEEARLRHAPLRAVASWRPRSANSAAGNRLVQAQLNRQAGRWTRLYPDLTIEPVVVRGSISDYLADNAESIQLFITCARNRHILDRLRHLDCSVLTVCRRHM